MQAVGNVHESGGKDDEVMAPVSVKVGKVPPGQGVPKKERREAPNAVDLVERTGVAKHNRNSQTARATQIKQAQKGCTCIR
ncbi:hypothetical protein PSHT_04957 [Puccinia striiformis]|uniref:Uncharacterized protein n=1 Tax=Puccinia striiformis TaxID=27350 RepID=A0A2S4WBN7_9BASI|nr:hypothetical protein PSHT_04957 [Puccinia striiformis]